MRNNKLLFGRKHVFLRLREKQATLVPNGVNCRKHGNNLKISKNRNFKQKAKKEALFIEVPNWFYKSAKLSPVFYWGMKSSVLKEGQ